MLKQLKTKSLFFTMSAVLLTVPHCATKSLSDEIDAGHYSGHITIIGAGAAGLTAGYLLDRAGIDFTILEASSHFGGRVRKIDSFADFPIDLGAEWIHTDPDVFAKILDQPDLSFEFEVITYNPKTVSSWINGKLRNRNLMAWFYSEHKFKDMTWYDFLENYLHPSIAENILYQQVVTKIDYSGTTIVLDTAQGRQFQTDRVIVTVPLTVLKTNKIEFVPALSSEKIAALNDVDMPAGLKVFIKFSQRFYPDMLLDGGVFENMRNIAGGEKLFYDVAFGKDSDNNVLALFAVGEPATEYTSLASDEHIVAAVIAELDMMLDGQATQYYQSHLVQNWSRQAFIEGSYSHYSDYSARDILAESIDRRVYFAGEAFASDSDLATVHGAALSSHKVVQEILLEISEQGSDC